MKIYSVTRDNTTVNKQVSQMRSLVLVAAGELEEVTLPIPEPGPNEVLLKMEGCGVCASSLPVWQGRDWFQYPLEPGVPGHEGWGIVEAVGQQVKGFSKGQRVSSLSTKAFSTHDTVDQNQLIPLPDHLDGYPFPGEPLGCAMNIFKRCQIQKGQTVAIIGVGFLGALLIQLAKSQGARVIGISKRPYSLEIADYVIPLQDHHTVINEVKHITKEKFCDCVIEVTGKEWPLNLGIELTKVRGRLVVAGFHQDGMRQVNLQLLNWRGIDMISAHERDQEKYVEGVKNAIQAIEENKLAPFSLFSNFYSMEEAAQAFQDLENRPRNFVKGIILFDQ